MYAIANGLFGQESRKTEYDLRSQIFLRSYSASYNPDGDCKQMIIM